MEDEETPPPKTLTELIYKMLDNALDYEITEKDFWDMTVGEVDRAVKSKIRRDRLKSQEKASFDYILADLIIRGVARALGDKSEYPSIEKAYTGLFDDVIEERKAKAEEQRMNLSALRFKQFAQSYNNGFKKQGGGKTINE